jgi:hypothetical protein
MLANMSGRFISTLLCLSMAFLFPVQFWPALADEPQTCCPCATEHHKGCGDCPVPGSQKRCCAATLIFLPPASANARLPIGRGAADYAAADFHFRTRTERPPTPPPKVS